MGTTYADDIDDGMLKLSSDGVSIFFRLLLRDITKGFQAHV